MPSAQLTLRFKKFRGTMASWDDLFSRAAEFATEVGRDRLVTISHSADHSDGVVTVWYWAGPDDPAALDGR